MRAIIAGAGVAGLTLAVLLSRQGWQVEVHERSPRLRTLGAGFTLWSNATAILSRLGLRDWLEKEGQPILEGQILNPRGILLSHPIGRLSHEWGSPTLGVHRGELLEALAALVPPGCLRLGSRVEERPTDCDLFVAADGIHSAFRHDSLRYAGYLGCWGVAAYPPPRSQESLWMLGAHATMGRIPLTQQRVFWFATVAMGESQARRCDFAQAREVFSGWPEAVRSFLFGLEPGAALVTPIYDRRPSRRWGDGRCWTLLGDAAHATTPSFGHGACLAIESAWELASNLHNLAQPAALARYERLRQQRSARIIEWSYWVGRLFHLGSGLSPWRDSLLRWAPRALHEKTLRAIVMG